MNASSLSGECARRNSVVFGVAAGVDILVAILNAHQTRTIDTHWRGPVRKIRKVACVWCASSYVREYENPQRIPYRAGSRLPFACGKAANGASDPRWGS